MKSHNRPRQSCTAPCCNPSYWWPPCRRNHRQSIRGGNHSWRPSPGEAKPQCSLRHRSCSRRRCSREWHHRRHPRAMRSDKGSSRAVGPEGSEGSEETLDSRRCRSCTRPHCSSLRRRNRRKRRRPARWTGTHRLPACWFRGGAWATGYRCRRRRFHCQSDHPLRRPPVAGKPPIGVLAAMAGVARWCSTCTIAS